MEKETRSTVVRVYNNPVKSVSDEEDNFVFGSYQDLIVARINDEPHCYHGEVMQHLLSAPFCGMLGQFHKEIECSDKSDRSRGNIKQVNYTLRKFIGLLSRGKSIHCPVSYLANELRYAPKHPLKVAERACDRTPSDSTNETAMEQIEYRLKHSDKSIKEIAEKPSFPNQSFFGKYVKTYLGTSPVSYQSRKEDI